MHPFNVSKRGTGQTMLYPRPVLIGFVFSGLVTLGCALGIGARPRPLHYSVPQATVVYAGIPDDSSLTTAWHNGALLNSSLAQLKPGDVFLVPNKTFYVMGGIQAANLRSVVIRIDGVLTFNNNMSAWPRSTPGKKGKVLECLQFDNITNVTFTSAEEGLLDGQGSAWWGFPGVGYLEIGENRPRLLNIGNSRDVLIERLYFKNSPYWTVWVPSVDGLEIRYVRVDARRDNHDDHDLDDLSAFNTDGLDVSGNNVYIHDCVIWNQDDCVAVKDGSQNMLIERVNASGLGLTIGSIGGSTVQNITFRDCYMHHTYKGIYMKFRGNGMIKNITYENIVMDAPEQYAIWIGPAQQSDSSNLCAPHPCSICWPLDPFAKCDMPAGAAYQDITLKNITVNNPKQSPGVIIGSPDMPMQNIVFDDVVINNPGKFPFGSEFYKCEAVGSGIATGGTTPVPPCFQKTCDHSLYRFDDIMIGSLW